LEIQQQISESFLILTPLNEFLDKSSNITINQLVEYEIQRNKSAKDSGKTNEYKLKNYVTNRRAIIIGINRYESTLTIPSLEGAENDAIEISDRLSYNAGFQISDKDYLLGSNATRKNILKAFNDVFRNNSDLVLFYFSGYIIIDKENNKVYLASYDIDPEDPFGSGIKIEDLNNVIYKSKNKASLIIILDCCYARIATQDTKKYDTAAGVENESLKNIYVDNLYKIIRDDNRLASVTSETSIEGKIILASSEATAVSRERHDCKHINSNDPPHSHGAFSFHLLEGLDGKAADPDTGFITIHTLKKYIENQMLAEQRQKPIYCIAEAWKIENIIIAVSQQQFNTKISSLIRDTKDLLAIKDPNNNFVDIRKIEEAVRKIKELINLDPKNKEIPKLQTIIDDSLNMYKQPVIEWLGNNMMVARLKINEIKSDLYDYELPDLFDSLSFNELSKIEKSKLAILIHLSSEVKRNTKFESEEDPKLKILIAKLRAAFDSFGFPKTRYY
jgi:hypothetical protein